MSWRIIAIGLPLPRRGTDERKSNDFTPIWDRAKEVFPEFVIVEADTNGDGEPGFKGVDDDGDGQVDNGNRDDDDEDGIKDEDWLDTVVFFLQLDQLIERHPVPWDETGSDGITGRDFIEMTIAEDVSRFRVERITGSGNGEIVDITLEVTGAETGETVSLHSRVRIGGSP